MQMFLDKDRSFDKYVNANAITGVESEVKDYHEQLKQMLQDLAKEKEKNAEKPLPLMNQVLKTP